MLALISDSIIPKSTTSSAPGATSSGTSLAHQTFRSVKELDAAVALAVDRLIQEETAICVIGM
jgi:hypothetical protein